MGVSSEPTKLLLVDDERELVWSLAQRVRKERPSWLVETASDGVDAIEMLKSTRFDVLVADIRMPRMNGLELVIAARNLRSDLHVVVMTAYPTNDVLTELRERGSIEYLEKPFEFSAFLDAIRRSVQKKREVGFTGSILVQTLPDVVQLYALSNASGALHVHCGDRAGIIWFERGQIPHAQTHDLIGTDAFYEIMRWKGGDFSMRLGGAPTETSIAVGWMELVMESCRMNDEAQRDAGDQDAPSTGWTLIPPTESLSTENVAATSAPRPPALPTLGNIEQDIPKEKQQMATIKESLGKLDSIDGFVGACLVDSESGMVLGTEGGGTLNLEVAGAANTEVVRAKRKAAKALGLKDDIEDILITLGKQYHMIRPLKAKPQVFFYLALDRSRANLGMARITLADVERELHL